MKVLIERDISQERIEDLLCGAFEGGSNYWACTGVTQEQMDKVGAEYPFEVATRGGQIAIFDAEDPDTLLGVLNETRIQKAFELMSQGKNENGEYKSSYKEYLQDFLDENEDANTSDIFLQIAVFGTVVYS